MTAKDHMQIVADIGCVICRRDTGQVVPCQVHHIAEGSGQRSDYMTAGLCYDHHQGGLGVHGMGVRAFCRMYKLSSEYDLLGLVNQYRSYQ